MEKKLTKFITMLMIVWSYNYIFSMDSVVKDSEQDNTMAHYFVETSQGKISVVDSQFQGLAVLCIHGNSACGQIFKKQFANLGSKFRLIALDLPGHGDSDPARDESVYSFPGYARVIAEVIEKLGLKKLVLVGWSLGGHIALELTKLVEGIQGVLITGTPPMRLSQEGIKKAFKPFEGLHLLGHEPQFTREEAELFMGLGGINVKEEGEFIVEAAMKARGIARKAMMQSVGNGIGCDEVELVKNMTIPLAIVMGELDKGINTEYIMNDVQYNTLWNKSVAIIKNCGHAVFWEKPQEFNAVLNSFLNTFENEVNADSALKK